MRHAHATGGSPGGGDHDRPLTDRGRTAARRVALEMATRGWVPDEIVCSTAARCQQTAAILAETWADSTPVRSQRSLYNAMTETILMTVRDRLDAASSSNSRMILSHNPGISHVASHLGGTRLGLSPASVVMIHAAIDRPADLSAATVRDVQMIDPADL